MLGAAIHLSAMARPSAMRNAAPKLSARRCCKPPEPLDAVDDDVDVVLLGLLQLAALAAS